MSQIKERLFVEVRVRFTACRLDYFFPIIACPLEHFTREKVITVIDDRLKVRFSRHHRSTQTRQFAKKISCLHQPRHLFSPNVLKITAADARTGLPRASISARQEGQVGKMCRAMLAY
jgi:hypothetical protein